MDQSREVQNQWIAQVVAQVKAGNPVRVSVPGGGRLLLERRYPFICLYRRGPEKEDPGTERLVMAEASYLVVRDTGALDVSALLEQLVPPLEEKFGAVLILELWAGKQARTHHEAKHQSGPEFVIHAQQNAALGQTVEVLSQALAGLRERQTGLSAHVVNRQARRRPGFAPVLPAALARRHNCHWLGVEVPPRFRSSDGHIYPLVLRRLSRYVSRCIKRACHQFATGNSLFVPPSYHSLGHRLFVKAVWEADARLADLTLSFDFLLQTTPVNDERAWRAFRRSHFQDTPSFRYRALPVDPATAKRELFAIPLGRIDDPTLWQLFRERQVELDRKLTMLSDLGTPEFLYGALALYGPVSPYLLRTAMHILSSVQSDTRAEHKQGLLDAGQFAALARQEVALYAKQDAGFSPEVVVRDDIHSGLLVSYGRLLVGAGVKIPVSRAQGLLAHEVGTHLVTHHNGKAQPFRQMSLGLAGYEEMQEGLAVLAEYLVGGLTANRLRVLAIRVLACHRLMQGESFSTVFSELHEEHRFPQREAFNHTMRVFRGGGLLKDAVYLRGLLGIMRYLALGGELEPLFLGKLAAHHVPFIRELQLRGILVPVPIAPRYLETESGQARLAKLRDGLDVCALADSP